MAQMYKVFFNNNSLFLAKKPIQKQSFFKSHKYQNISELKDFVFNFCMHTKNKNILIHHNSLPELWDVFTSLFKIKTAGGGIVENSNQEILFIKRRGLWDLPKGHQEKNEDIETTAIREVSEECGIDNLELRKPLITTYHTYYLNEQAILKPTYWYAMKYLGKENGSPQIEEDITEVKWVNKNQIEEVFSNTFPSIIDVINDYFEDLAS